MRISVKLDDLLHDRRMTLTALADPVGMTLANLSILKTGKARAIRFSTLEAICEALSCQPGDLLRFEPAQAEGELPSILFMPFHRRPTSSAEWSGEAGASSTWRDAPRWTRAETCRRAIRPVGQAAPWSCR
jgi:putative transcriptional regulator